MPQVPSCMATSCPLVKYLIRRISEHPILAGRDAASLAKTIAISHRALASHSWTSLPFSQKVTAPAFEQAKQGLSWLCSQEHGLTLARCRCVASYRLSKLYERQWCLHRDASVLPVNSRLGWQTHLGRCAGLRQPISPIERSHAGQKDETRTLAWASKSRIFADDAFQVHVIAHMHPLSCLIRRIARSVCLRSGLPAR